MSDIRVLAITPHLTPYRVALFNRISNTGRCDLNVLSLTDKEPNRSWQLEASSVRFSHAVARGIHLHMHRKEVFVHVNTGVSRLADKLRPHVVVVSGYDQPAYWNALFRFQRYGCKRLLWSGTTETSARSSTGIRRLLKAQIVRQADGFIAYGTLAKEYLVRLGAHPDRVTISTNTVDMDYFRTSSNSYRERSDFWAQRSRFPRFLLLFVGQLIRRKGIANLLKALRELDDPDVGLILVGNGPLEAQLKRMCNDLLGKQIFFEGHHQLDTLPQFYALADALVLPSLTELWGLVLNEALAAGLYSLTSERAGAAHDLIRKGWNGDVFDPTDTRRLCLSIRAAKDRLEELRCNRERISLDACDSFSLRHSAASFVDAIEREARSADSRRANGLPCDD